MEIEKRVNNNSDIRIDDFVLDNELTVTITLHEYRELLENIFRLKKESMYVNNRRFEVEDKNKELQKEIEELKTKLSKDQ